MTVVQVFFTLINICRENYTAGLSVAHMCVTKMQTCGTRKMHISSTLMMLHMSGRIVSNFLHGMQTGGGQAQ